MLGQMWTETKHILQDPRGHRQRRYDQRWVLKDEQKLVALSVVRGKDGSEHSAFGRNQNRKKG
jgi:hypothetical protein